METVYRHPVYHDPISRLEHFVLLPSSFSQSLLCAAASFDCVSLDLITYAVLIVPNPPTSALLVASVFCNAFRIWVLTSCVEKYLAKCCTSGSPPSGPDEFVLIRRQYISLFRLLLSPVGDADAPTSVFARAAPVAHDVVEAGAYRLLSSFACRARSSP